MAQIKVQKTKEYFVYYKFYELRSWGKRSAGNRRRFIIGYASIVIHFPYYNEFFGACKQYFQKKALYPCHSERSKAEPRNPFSPATAGGAVRCTAMYGSFGFGLTPDPQDDTHW